MGDPLCVEGCRLIVTTCSLAVCRRIDCGKRIIVKTLETDESWTLFKKTLGDRTELTSEVEKIAKCLAKKCGGLPHGIINLAKRMRGVTHNHEWMNMYNKICESPMEFDEMKEKVFPDLMYSFDILNQNLQLCLLYCSLYPYEIDKDELVRRFISEELVNTTKCLEKQLDQGYTMLSELVDRCILQRIGDSKYVKMNDLWRDVALSIARESPKYKVFAGLALKEIPNEEEWTEDAEKISLMSNQIEEIPIGMAPYCPKLATLLLNDNPLKSIPESFFAEMSGLRVLDLSQTSIRELPNSLSDLESLNTLLLYRCYALESVPYLGQLKALRELDLSHTSIEKMPKGMENLINLKIILFSGANNLKLLPGDLPLKSQNLQHLELPLEIELPVYEIEWSKLQLRKFVGRFKDVSDFNWFQSQTDGLISNFYCYVRSMHDDRIEDDNNLMDENKLSMYKCSLRRGEMEDGVIILPEKIQVLKITRCKGLSRCLLDDFKPCSSVIKELKIEDCEGIESIWNINDQLMAETIVNVVSVDLDGLPDLKGLVNWEVGGGPGPGRLPCPPPQAATLFSSLQRLYIYGCDKMKTLGLPLPCLHNITSIEVYSCAEIEELIELVEDDEEISEPPKCLPNLESLTLENLPKLKSICKARIDCKSIQEIEIRKCPRVKKLPLFLPSSSSSDGQVINYSPPPALRVITIEKEMWESLEWDDIRHKHALEPIFGKTIFGSIL